MGPARALQWRQPLLPRPRSRPDGPARRSLGEPEALLDRLRDGSNDGAAVDRWSVYASESSRFSLGIKDRQVGNAHAPLGVVESSAARYLIVWDDGLVSRGTFERAQFASRPDEALVAAAHPGLTSLQIIFNVFRQNAIADLFPIAQENDIGIIVRLPLASGVLSGKMSKDQHFAANDHRSYNRRGEAFSQGETFSGVPFEMAVDLVDELKEWLPEGLTMAQMAMRWILDFPAVTTVITGASKPEQVVENASVSELPPLCRSNTTTASAISTLSM